jgi:transketolase
MKRVYPDLETLCKEVRKSIIKMCHEKRMSHVGSAFSMVEILVTLYFGILRVNPEKPKDPNRDIFILSKGHACIALFNVLARRGFFPVEQLKTYCDFNSAMGGHPDRHLLPGIEICSGALGHGFSVGIGMAIASRYDKKDNKVVVLMGDGELDEGSVWEGIMAASHYKLDNLIAIVDRNGLQADSRTEEAMALEPLIAKWKSFGWNVQTIDGHNLSQLNKTLKDIYNIPQKGIPNVVIARTIKGKGVSFIEDQQAWHFNIPTQEDVEMALKELA